MAYAVQLLPTEEEARFIRDVLTEYTKENATERERDIAWKYISQISIALAKKK